jgi:transcriptional regulator with XRE-family HTH domain
MTTLADVAEMLRGARLKAGLSQEALAQRAGVARTTVARMENLSKGDMSVSVLVRLFEAAGYELKLVNAGHARTVEDILAEQRQGDAPRSPSCTGVGRKPRAASSDNL